MTVTTRTIIRGCALAIVLLAGLRAATLSAQSADLGGSATFRLYCASCHGTSARGDGPLASSMRIAPADLTQIARRSGGAFPADRVARIIDGRTPRRAHGSEMPVWGDAFAGSRIDSASVAQRIQRLVAYLQSIQQPAQ